MTASLPLQELATLRLAAASALVVLDERLYVLGDDELLLQRYSLTGGFIDQRPLLAGELPQALAERKRLKPDFEMLCELPDGCLLALGSGSTAQRCRAVLVDGEQTRVIDLSELYGALATQLPELNLEGAVVQGQQPAGATRQWSGWGQCPDQSGPVTGIGRTAPGRAIGQCAVRFLVGRAG